MAALLGKEKIVAGKKVEGESGELGAQLFTIDFHLLLSPKIEDPYPRWGSLNTSV